MAPLVLVALLQATGTPPSVPAGEIVTAVGLDAPAGEEERLRRYLEITPGEPLDPQAVRHAVELLYAAGEFADVLVEARPAGEGVELVFRPVPAPRLRDIEVEGDRVLSRKAIRRITRLRPREPLWSARLERAARDAAVALSAEGYLEARVTAAARGHGPQTDAVFSVAAGRRARVSRVAIESNEALVADALRDLTEPDVREVFRREQAQKAAERMRKRLAESGHWRATVTLREAYDPATAHVALVFEANPGPPMAVEFRGARPPGDLRSRIVDLLEEGGAGADVLEDAADRLEQAFRRQGFREVAISRSEESRLGRVLLVYEIRPGPVARVASVRLVGAPREGLAALVETRAGEPLQESLIEEDARRITRAMEAGGYAEVRVETEVPEGGGEVPVLFRIHEGPRTVVSAFTLDSPVPVPTDSSAREMRLRPGRPYVLRDLALDRNTVLAAYRNAGYLQAEATPHVVLSEDKSEAVVTLRVAPGPRTEVDHVVVAGLADTKEAVVRRELRLREGDPLGLQNVLESQRRLGALGIFQRVSVTEMDPESVGRRSLVVALEEAPRTTVAYGVGWAEREGFRGSVEVSRRNLFGMDRSLSLFGRYSLRGNRELLNFREPYLFGSRVEAFLTGFREEEDRETFDFVRTGVLTQGARRLAPDWSAILRYTFQKTDTFNVEVPLDEVDRQFQDSTFAGPSASIVNDTRDDPLDPHRGRFLGADLALSSAALGGDSFVKGYFQASWYQRVHPRLVLALGGRLGLARTFGDEPPGLPLPDRFFAGGDYSVRGFRVDTVGPLELSSSGELVPTGGNALAIGSAELRMDAGLRVSLAVFSDVGNVYPLVSDLDLGDLRYTAGVGLRYRSAFGPLRIDWGFKLNRRPDESPSHLHFTVGHAF